MDKGLGEEMRLVRVAAQLPAQISKFNELMYVYFALLVLGDRADLAKLR
jgi:hypothetical protein